MSHQYLPWNGDDIFVLEDLYTRGYTHEQIAACLKRTPRAIEHAVRHMITQHMIHYGKEATLKKFSIDESSIKSLVSPPIYQPVHHRTAWDSYCPAMTILTTFVLFGILSMYGMVQPLEHF